ncbi:MAG: hypothetical protein M3332_13430, partial [Actinomycetota bacterium]|nr:hypothetical protein [Actinomycetota bacterium]
TDNIPSMMHLPGRHRRRGGPDGTLDHPLPRHRLDAVLVHPDRFIAWRSAEHSNPQELEAALRHVLDR